MRIPKATGNCIDGRYFGKDIPRAWFDAFVKNGRNGRFVRLPGFGDDGPPGFTRNPGAWKPAFEALLRGLNRPESIHSNGR